MAINKELKQVIVMRNDLSMRRGKQISQACHASIGFLSDIVLNGRLLTPEQKIWLKEGMTKICVRVDSEEELLDINQKAISAGLLVHLITDAGLTEFHGIPTKTCLSIGPNLTSAIDCITGQLKLL